jgi:hypothetical protein
LPVERRDLGKQRRYDVGELIGWKSIVEFVALRLAPFTGFVSYEPYELRAIDGDTAASHNMHNPLNCASKDHCNMGTAVAFPK